jgi:hypothetical protein
VSTSVIAFGDDLAGFTITTVQSGPLFGDRTAFADDASLGHFLGLLRAANAYVNKFSLPTMGRLEPDGTITENDVATLRVISAHAGFNFSDRKFTVAIAAASAAQLAVQIAGRAGVRADFSVSDARPAPPTESPPAPDATSPPTAPPPKKMGTGVKVAIGVGATVVGFVILSKLAGR